MAYQSLYRRYRPRRFEEVRGQDHLVRAIRNAVREDRVGHAYLLSGPRGTGKTTTARILAKVLNCEAPLDGEPCGTCASCVAIDAGTSFDVHELDAASNNKVDDVRDLIAKASLGTPGRTKVYILDEVHMLTPAASNALLKTLEEPPEHVVFVLATTDPHKVLPTIRSRTQHFELGLLGAEELRSLVADVAADAGLDVDEAGIDYVVAAGGGSARDTLSALDQVVAAGAAPQTAGGVDELIDAIAARDTAAALATVEVACSAGQQPRGLGEALLARLRDVFLVSVGVPVTRLTDDTLARADAQAERLGAPGATHALEVLGAALTTIIDAPDPRVTLEVALVRLTRPDVDVDPVSLAARLDRLERAMADGAPIAATAAPASESSPETPSETPEPSTTSTSTSRGRPADAAREKLASTKRKGGSDRSATKKRPTRTPEPEARSESDPPKEPAAATATQDESTPPADPTSGGSGWAGTGAMPTRDALTLAWGDVVLDSLPQKVKARFGAGRWVGIEDDAAVYGLPNDTHRQRCDDVRPAVEEALAAHFGVAVPVRLVVDDQRDDASMLEGGRTSTPADSPQDVAAGSRRATAGPTADDDEWVDVAELEDADAARSHVDRVADIFPGAELVED